MKWLLTFLALPIIGTGVSLAWLDPPASQKPQPAKAATKTGDPVPYTSKSGRLKGWKQVIPGGRPLAAPAVYHGSVFLGGGFGSHEFYAFDAITGKKLWQYHTHDDSPSAAVAEDGYIAFNTESCELEILTVSGKRVWNKWLGDPLISMPAIHDGQVYMAYPDSRHQPDQYYLACFTLKTGKEVWRKPIAAGVITAPVVRLGKVYAATVDGTLYEFSQKDGTLVWQEKKNATSAPVVYANRCFFSRRQATTIVTGKKKVEQQTERLATRGIGSNEQVRDYVVTARTADYLDYSKRMHSADEMKNQANDASVGFGAGFSGGSSFGGGGVGGMSTNLTGSYYSNPLASGSPAKPTQPSSSAVAKAGGPTVEPVIGFTGSSGGAAGFSGGFGGGFGGFGGGMGGFKFGAALNIGQASVAGVWAYQGSRPAVQGNRLYIALADTLECVDPITEKQIWSCSITHQKKGDLLDSLAAPPVAVNGKVFLVTAKGDLLCFDAKTGKQLWHEELGETVTFQPAIVAGRLYVTTNTGSLYCLETGDAHDDGWPMWGGNAAHCAVVK